MKTLTISSDDEKALEKVRHYAESLGITTRSTSSSSSTRETNGKEIVEILKKWHEEGGLKTKIDDPVAWQREMRKDQKLPFRD